MTERRRPRLLPTILATVACFLVAFEFLAFQLASGKDPALGSQVLAGEPVKRPVVIDRRIIKRRIVHDPAPVSASPSALASTALAPAAPAPSSSAPAPASAAAALAPAPAPAVTSSS